jgi:platelet-activating factor acetylhydrolase
LSTDVQVPILIADSEVWSAEPAELDGQDHFTTVKGIAETSLGASNAGWFLTLLGTAHVSITDAGLIAGQTLLSVFDPSAANATLEPAMAIERYVNASVEFFRYLKTNTAAGILAVNVTDPEYVRRPANSSTPGDEASYWEIHVAPVAK